MVELLVLLGLVIVGLVVAGAVRARRRSHPHDDTLRVGDGEELDRKDAALRSMGKNSWMRPGGGGI
jgi:hypothetical protein